MIETPGRRLSAWLTEPGAGRSQSWLARILEIGQPSVSNWCNDVFVPEPMHRRAIAILAGKNDDGVERLPEDIWLTEEQRAQLERIETLATSRAPAIPDTTIPFSLTPRRTGSEG